MIEITYQGRARVERADEVSVTYADATFQADADALVVSRDGHTLAWYAPGVWTAVIFGVSS